MIKLLVMCSIIFLSTVCTNNIEKNGDNRMLLINKTITALSNYDTLTLYNLMDTSYCFDIYGKDGFLFKANYIYNRLKVCSTSYDEQKIKISPIPVDRTEYTIAFCRDANGSILNDSFDLMLTFSNDVNTVINFMDLKKYRTKIKSTTPADN